MNSVVGSAIGSEEDEESCYMTPREGTNDGDKVIIVQSMMGAVLEESKFAGKPSENRIAKRTFDAIDDNDVMEKINNNNVDIEVEVDVEGEDEEKEKGKENEKEKKGELGMDVAEKVEEKEKEIKIIRPDPKTLDEVSQRRNDLALAIKNFSSSIQPLEFESYSDYFIIHNFKKGRSASGRVDINVLRRREHSIYYTRIKRKDDKNGSESNSSTPNNLSDDSDSGTSHNLDKLNKDKYLGTSKSATPLGLTSSQTRITRSRISNNSSQNIQVIEQPTNSKPANLITCDISLKSIIPTPVPDGTIRRSSRISQKSTNPSLKEESDEEELDDLDDNPRIHDLFESLVPKVKKPYRRSDWILPTRSRYTPEKQLQTKPEYEVVKMNELVCTERVQAILSRFEGGVAGVRKKGWL
ncbi:hypothetical protein Kpol_413p10 [Vanderwaltozyma polyspora DSM 70294]|uniref:Uncharacterized protein n=1 Tax=Vanderwaltozyma polyspora (strain ATCC 22028 / DSM 70294 / BCRC 21397 / CBS 2163 / NBRC 10782 / NRRL Y-8283 / UCD 57-17) TaxID=436907 RepID=A7TRH5_VANPO|nr:uncharacterized protein Kpol_413p10 [Vanderwaltozyma polyspora DSM 70294]EDO15135.1 hypothetical protein Kpol_413p10 [Vanderwaltozyma polyspora DSM 70294]